MNKPSKFQLKKMHVFWEKGGSSHTSNFSFSWNPWCGYLWFLVCRCIRLIQMFLQNFSQTQFVVWDKMHLQVVSTPVKVCRYSGCNFLLAISWDSWTGLLWFLVWICIRIWYITPPKNYLIWVMPHFQIGCYFFSLLKIHLRTVL